MGFYCLPMEVEFQCAPNAPKGCQRVYPSFVGLMGWYDYVRRTIISFFFSLSFCSLIYRLCQSRRSAARTGDNVIVTPDPRPGKCHCI